MPKPIRVSITGHAYRASRTVCGKPLPTAAKTTTSSLSRITCSTCRLILSANPTTSRT